MEFGTAHYPNYKSMDIEEPKTSEAFFREGMHDSLPRVNLTFLTSRVHAAIGIVARIRRHAWCGG